MTFNPSEKFASVPTENSTILDVPYKMSPVTDLAMNLSGLTTSMTGTPSRRISWSDPFPSNSNPYQVPDNFSPYAESPMFQETRKEAHLKGVQRNCTKKKKLFKEVHNIQFQHKDEDKENTMPYITKTQNHPPKSFNEVVFDSDSHDSGYFGGGSQSSNYEVLQSKQSLPSVRSAICSDDGEDIFENIFEISNLDDDDDFSMMPDTMTSLLTKPISSCHESRSNLSLGTFTGLENTAKKKKLPARRCLSVEMDSDSAYSNLAFPMDLSLNEMTVSNEVEDVELHSPKKLTFKRPDPPNDYLTLHNKRRKSSPSVNLFTDSRYIKSFVLQRSYSETSATIMRAVQKSDLQPELIGDCSKSYALPLVKGKHEDLRSITPGTLVTLFQGGYMDEVKKFTVVDCRYPYEFEAGHIQGAKNIFTREDVLENFLSGGPSAGCERNIIIFHCEFSSERAPSLCRFLRNKDREKNEAKYPQLHQPEIYLLDGGYKAFFEDHKEYCEPRDYKPMVHKDHGTELREFRAKSKSWGGDSRKRTILRSGSRN